MISWLPTDDPYYIVAGMRTSAASIAALHVTQAAITELEALLAQGETNVPFGLLAGALCISRDTKQDYLLIDEIVPARHELSTEDPLLELENELRSLVSELEQRGKLVLGWYLGGMDVDLGLDPDIESIHRRQFTEAWQVVLVRSDEATEHRGAFFRFEAMTSRWYAIPFFELLPAGSRRGQAAGLRSGVRWVNYRTPQSVTPIDVPTVPQSKARAATRSQPLDSRLRSWFGALRRERYVAHPRRPERALRDDGDRAAASTAEHTAPPRASTPSAPAPMPQLSDAVAIRPDRGSAPMVASADAVEAAASETTPKGQSSELPEPDAPHVFINGRLVPLPAPSAAGVEDQLHARARLRTVLFTTLAVAMLIIAVASYLMTR